MQYIFRIFTALFSLILFAPPVFSQGETPLQLLKKMQNAVSTHHYELAFVHATPTNIASLRFRHIRQSEKPYSQLISLDGVPQEIIQRENVISYFQSNHQGFSIRGNHIVDYFPAVMWGNLDVIKQHYDFVHIGRNRVADRIVQTIRILPKDDFRYQYLVFVDEKTQLLLRSDLRDREGNLLDQFRVVNVYVGKNLQELPDYLNRIVFPPLLTDENEQQLATDFDWTPGWLPKGFKLINKSVKTDGLNRIETLLYSDGLFSFTLYSAPVNELHKREQAWRQGAITFFSDIQNNRVRTFIGQLPLTTAKRIIQDIRSH